MINYRTAGLIGILLHLCGTWIQAQMVTDVFVRSIGLADGLPSPYIHAITQDTEGYIWIGSSSGLSRYDGFNMEVLQEDEAGRPLLSGNFITALEWVNDSILAMGTFENGLNFLNIHNKTVKQIFDGNGEDRISNNRILFLKKDRRGILWIGTHKSGLDFYDHSNRAFSPFSFEPEEKERLSGNDIDLVFDYMDCRDDENYFWLATGRGLLYVHRETGEFEIKVKRDSGSEKLNWTFQSLAYASDSILLTGLWGGGLLIYNTINDQWKQLLYDPEFPLNGARNVVKDILKTGDNEFYLATHDQGLIGFRLPDQYFFPGMADSRGTSEPSQLYRVLYKDRDENIWLGGDRGVTLINKRSQNFQYLQLPHNYAGSLARLFSALSFSLGENTDVLYIGCWVGDGLYRLDLNNLTLAVLKPESSDRQVITINSIIPDGQYSYYLGTLEDGLHHYQPESNIFSKIPCDICRSKPRIRSMTLGEDQKLYIGTFSQGILQYHPDKGYKSLISGDSLIEGIQPGLINDMVITRGGKLAAATAGGVLLVDLKANTAKRLHYQNGYPPGFRAITALEYDDHEILWVGTENRGVYGLNDRMEIAHHLDEDNSLNNNFVRSILSGPNSELIVNTVGGMNIIKKSGEVFSYKAFNGFFHENSGKSYYHQPSKNLITATEKGIFMVDFGNLIKEMPCETRITGIVPAAASKTIQNKNQILIFQPNQTNITFEFNDFSFTENNTGQFRYRLQGFDDQYRYSRAGENSKTYRQLQPGKYIFEISALCNNGKYSQEGEQIHFKIRAALIHRWWFRLAVLVGISGGIGYFYHLRRKSIEDRQVFERRLSELKMETLRAQMNPHFIFNCLNSIRYLVQKKDHGKAVKYLNDFSHLVRLILEYNRGNTISLRQELEVVKMYVDLEQSRFSNRFKVHIKGEATEGIDGVLVPPLISQPFVENAIWHGLMHKKELGNLWIELKRETGTWILSIRDDGVGKSFFQNGKMPQAGIKKSHGTAITFERMNYFNKSYSSKIEIHSEDLYDSSDKPAGTLITIKIQQSDTNSNC